MKKFIFITVFALLLVMPSTLHAESYEISDEEGIGYVSGDELCTNVDYTLAAENSDVEVMILDSSTKQIMEVYTTNSGEATVNFPTGLSSVDIVVSDYTTEGSPDMASEVSETYPLTDCGYSASKEPYDKTLVKGSMSLDGTVLTVTKPSDATDYVFEYQYLEDNKADELKFDEATGTGTIDLKENTLIQFTETYDGKTYYYELEINTSTGSYFIRQVNSFSLKTIDPISLINFKAVGALLLAIILFIVIKIIYTKQRRKYNKMKLKEKRRRQGLNDEE